MKVKLLYGEGNLEIELPTNTNVNIIAPKKIESIEDPKAAISESLRKPIGSRPLCEVVQPGSKIGIIFNDITRATPNETIINAILKEIPNIPHEYITLYNALGTHRNNSQDELKNILSQELVVEFRIVQNNSFDRSTQKSIGKTKNGNEIWINRDLLENDLIILTGFIEPHFFAGYSGGGKAVMPGMAGIETILFNHGAKNIADVNSIWGKLEGNPIQQEVREVISKVDSTFLVNVALNNDKEITAVFSGDVIEAHDVGCEYVKKSALVPVTEPFDVVITSNSGYPLDQNLYQAVKGMSAAAQIVKDGGTIIMASECRDGLPDHGLFGELLSKANSKKELLDMVNQPDFKKLDQWQVQVLALIQNKAEIFVYSDYLDRETLESRLLSHTNNIRTTIEYLIKQYGEKIKIAVLPEGPLTITYVE